MSQGTDSRRKLYAILCLLGCIVAIAGEAMMVKMFLDALAIKSWPTAEGTVLQSELTRSPSNGYKGEIEYEFEVGRRNYKSSSVRTRGTSTKYKSDARAVVERFPVGSQCTVYYKEGAPDVSYLEAGVGIVNYLIIVSPLLFVWMFGAGCWGFLKPNADGSK